MNVSFSCSSCGQQLKAPAARAGARAKCPKCGKDVVVPKPLSSQKGTGNVERAVDRERPSSTAPDLPKLEASRGKRLVWWIIGGAGVITVAVLGVLIFTVGDGGTSPPPNPVAGNPPGRPKERFPEDVEGDLDKFWLGIPVGIGVYGKDAKLIIGIGVNGPETHDRKAAPGKTFVILKLGNVTKGTFVPSDYKIVNDNGEESLPIAMSGGEMQKALESMDFWAKEIAVSRGEEDKVKIREGRVTEWSVSVPEILLLYEVDEDAKTYRVVHGGSWVELAPGRVVLED